MNGFLLRIARMGANIDVLLTRRFRPQTFQVKLKIPLVNIILTQEDIGEHVDLPELEVAPRTDSEATCKL
jgi:hypothetical protein